MIYLGCHVSFKAPDYFKGAIEEAVSYGANACMIYTCPPSNTRRVDVSKLKIDEAKTFMLDNDFSIDRVIVHAPYIINLANALKPETAEFGREFSEKHIGPVFDMENATFESMEPSECEQLLSLTRKYVQILKKNMKQYVLEEKEF